MNPPRLMLAGLMLASGCILQPASRVHAATTIDPANRYAYAANLGWLDCRGGTNNGVVFGEYVCSGYLYSANVGWISFEATGAPVVDLLTGNFSGYAYSANCGWISLNNAVAISGGGLHVGDGRPILLAIRFGYFSL